METLDWQHLAGTVSPDKSRIPYEQNKHLFRKVAFDVFQPKCGPADSLWVLEEADDGTPYLVAQYDDNEDREVTLKSESSWTALTDKQGENVTLMYKDMPIKRFASSDYGFNKNDVHLFQGVLVEKLSQNDNFKKKLLRSLPLDKRNMLLQKFPELA